MFKVDWSVIQTRLHNNNIDTSFKPNKAKDWRIDLEENIEDIIKMYVKDKISTTKIAKKYSTSAVTITTHLKYHNVKLRAGNCQAVNQFTIDGIFIRRFNTMKEAAAAVGLCRGIMIKKALEREDKISKGYKWGYAE